MTSVFILALLALSAWLAVKLDAANKDNAQLRTKVDSLRRQLQRQR